MQCKYYKSGFGYLENILVGLHYLYLQLPTFGCFYYYKIYFFLLLFPSVFLSFFPSLSCFHILLLSQYFKTITIRKQWYWYNPCMNQLWVVTLLAKNTDFRAIKLCSYLKRLTCYLTERAGTAMCSGLDIMGPQYPVALWPTTTVLKRWSALSRIPILACFPQKLFSFDYATNIYCLRLLNSRWQAWLLKSDLGDCSRHLGKRCREICASLSTAELF